MFRRRAQRPEGATDEAETYRDIGKRVNELLAALAGATTYPEAMSVLSMADMTTLRVVESRFLFLPAAAADIRERLATAHLQRIAGGQGPDTSRVTSSWISDLISDLLAANFDGITDFDESVGGQYKVTNLGRRSGAELYAVTTVEGFDQRVFRVRISVEPDVAEVQAA